MSAVRVYAIACDFPDCTDETTDGELSARDARSSAYLSGWTFRNGRDFCPDHIDATAEQIRTAGGSDV